MDLEYWKQRALEAETALKGAAGSAVDATKAGVGAAADAGSKAWSATRDAVDPLASKAGAAVGKGVDAASGAVSDLETMFLDQFAAPPQSPAPLPDDPINQAIPPHLRQFYGAEGNYGQPPAEEAPDPGMMDQALKAAEDAFNSVMKMGKGAPPRAAGPMPPQFPGGGSYPAPGVRVPGR